MTLIAGILTKDKGYLIGDKTRSVDGVNGQPVSLDMTTESGMKIKINSPKIRINAHQFSKLHKITDTIAIGGAGNMANFEAYITFIKQKNDNFIEHTRQYFSDQQDNAPDQIIVLSKDGNSRFADIFAKSDVGDMKSFYYQRYYTKDDGIGICAIGCGNGIFLNMYSRSKESIIRDYKQKLSESKQEEWKQSFITKLSGMYADVSKYDDAVGNEIDIIEI